MFQPQVNDPTPIIKLTYIASPGSDHFQHFGSFHFIVRK